MLGPLLLRVLVGESRCSVPTFPIPSSSLIGESVLQRLIIIVVVKVLPVVGESILISLPCISKAIIKVSSGIVSTSATASLWLVSSGVENTGRWFDVKISLLQFLRCFGDFTEMPCLEH